MTIHGKYQTVPLYNELCKTAITYRYFGKEQLKIQMKSPGSATTTSRSQPRR